MGVYPIAKELRELHDPADEIPPHAARHAIMAILSTGCIVRETVTEHGEVVSDRLEVKEPFEKKPEPTL